MQHAWVDVDVDPLLDWRLQYCSVAYLGDGMAALYDAAAATVQMMPGLAEPRDSWEPVSFYVTDARPGALYVMGGRTRTFKALVYGDPAPAPHRGTHMYAWHWHQLPPPPPPPSSPTHCSTAMMAGPAQAAPSVSP